MQILETRYKNVYMLPCGRLELSPEFSSREEADRYAEQATGGGDTDPQRVSVIKLAFTQFGLNVQVQQTIIRFSDG